MWKTVFTGLQFTNPCSYTYGRPSICMPIWWLQQEICPINQSQIPHPHTCQGQVSCIIVTGLMIFRLLWFLYCDFYSTCILLLGHIFFCFYPYVLPTCRLPTWQHWRFYSLHSSVLIVICMPESLVWSIFTQEVVFTKMKNPANSSEKLTSPEMAFISQQSLIHGL